MADVVKHKFTSAKADGADATLVRPSNWNAEHLFAGGSNYQALVKLASETDGAIWAAIRTLLATGGQAPFLSTDVIEAVVKRIRESSGPTTLLVGAIGDGEFVKRSGAALVGAAGGVSDHGALTGLADNDHPQYMTVIPNFTSTEQTVAFGTTLDVAHGLGVVPVLVQVVLRCKTAEFGYAIGDEVSSNNTDGALTGLNLGLTIVANATNVSVIQGASDVHLLRKDTQVRFAPTVANWKWVVRAWA